MDGDLLDVVLAVAAVLFAFSGYRQGFVVGVLSFVGFLGGGVLGARLAPAAASSSLLDSLPRAAVGLMVVFLLASVGQVLATVIGGALRRRLTWKRARSVDAAAGAVISVVSLLLVSWLVGRAVADSPYSSAASQVRRSIIIGAVDDVVPDSGRRLFSSLRNLVDERGFPEVFSDLRPSQVRDVQPPDPALAGNPVVAKVRSSVLKVTGVAPSCSRKLEGTGFVYARERVMTNAHVVAGVTEPRVQVGDRSLAARVVLFDPRRDVAVLAVPGLTQPALPFVPEPAKDGADAIVLGYPLDGPFRPDAARVVRRQMARGADLYDDGPVTREIYTVQGQVRQGNSGGPLITPAGAVLGVVFAAAADDDTVGYVLTAAEVSADARAGREATMRVSTGRCV